MQSPVPLELPPIGLAELKQAVAAAVPDALLLRPMILRRVIRVDRRLTGFRLKTPHRKSYVIGREALLEIVDEVDLELPHGQPLPERVMLIEQPSEQELASRPGEQILIQCWRLLFHARVHLAMDQKEFPPAALRRKILAIGVVQFDEIRSVLGQERFLLPPTHDAAVYTEFAAVYLELRHFAPSFLTRYFPGLDDLAAIDALLAEDLDAAALCRATRPQGSPDPDDPFQSQQWTAPLDEVDLEPVLETALGAGGPSPWLYRVLLGLANRAERTGNLVRSAIYVARALHWAPESLAGRPRAMLKRVMNRLAERLLAALERRGQSPRPWCGPLLGLAEQAAHGVWNAEARLLYDLQKVCLDSERETSTVDLVEWALSRGRRPICRPLPNQREVLISRHLRSAARRLTTVRITDEQRRELSVLLSEATARAEEQLRRRLRPLILGALDDVGLEPANLPETMAQRKLAEELLDRVVDHGFIALGDLRDAISRNNLKLPDVPRPADFLRGDRLLAADRRMAEAIDGVYRRGEFYLRAMQRLSSLAFGTRSGRFLTRYVVVPFGGSYLVLAGLDHLVELVAHRSLDIKGPTPLLLLGLFFMGLLYVERFRQLVRRVLRAAGRTVRAVAIDLPLWMAQLPVLRQILDSRLFVLSEHYLLKPLFWTAVVCMTVPFHWTSWTTALVRCGAVFLAVSLVLNSRLGREMEETVTTWAVESWHRFGVRILAGLFYYIRDLFWTFLQTIERVLYAVDQWLRFRSGQGRLAMAMKGLLGMAWFFVTYGVRFGVNLLIEPQINPIKHFPVVTVSHKLLLPLIPSLAGVLELTMEKGFAYTVATAVIASVPGVFGFLVWELQENWRLYAANRSRDLGPVLIGHHGENMGRLLRPGLHSGTIPKRYARLRRAERQARAGGNWRGVRKHLLALEQIRHSVHRYVDREFRELLALSPQWNLCPPAVDAIHIGTNRIRLQIGLAEHAPAMMDIALETRSGWIMAGAADRGLLAVLTPDQRQTLATALLGMYKTAGVELARQPLEVALSHPAGYDVLAEQLVVWPDPALTDEVSYPLGDNAADPRARLLFTETRVSWEQWVAAWTDDDRQPASTVAATALLLGDDPIAGRRASADLQEDTGPHRAGQSTGQCSPRRDASG